MRTYGLSGSGMDVDQMVKDMMKARRASYDKVWQKKTQLEWKKADYNTMYTSLRDFRNTTAFNYKMQSTLIPKKISSTAESTVSATANADAADVSHIINVTQLAEGAKITSAGSISQTTDKTSLLSQFGLDQATPSFTIKINGNSTPGIQVDPKGTIYDFVNNINKAGVGVKANYDPTLDRFFINTIGSGSEVKIDFGGSDLAGLDFINKTLKLADVTSTTPTSPQNGIPINVDSTRSISSLFGVSGKFTLKMTNGTTTKDISIDTTQSLDKFISDINSIAGTGINAYASYNTDIANGFTLRATDGTLSVAGSDQAAIDFLNSKLGLNISQTTPNPIGKDAQFNLDGVNLSQASNTFTISGVTYNLKAQGPANIVVSPDNEKAISNVKTFIDSYNATIEKINGELKEEKYSTFMPLTIEQKKDMKDSEITDWEKQAKSGMLRRDSILQDAIYKLRSDVSTPVSGLVGKYNSLASIGVTTGDYTEGGKLYLDETKLKKALEEDPDAISKIFGTSSNTRANQGVAVRFYDTLKTSMDKIGAVGGYSGTINDDNKSSLAMQIVNYNKDLTSMNDRLQDIEARYYKQFDAMETALSKMSQQSSWLSQQLGS